MPSKHFGIAQMLLPLWWLYCPTIVGNRKAIALFYHLGNTRHLGNTPFQLCQKVKDLVLYVEHLHKENKERKTEKKVFLVV